MHKVRVRFAPSPTGFLHIGGMRSALFNWLFAKKTDGVFILRLEDTDRERYVPEAVAQIKDSLKWLGLDPDEVAVQSERLDFYKKFADELVKNEKLYPCWCRAARLDELREKAKTEKRAFKYDRHCLNNPGDLKEPHVLRFLIPAEPKVIDWDDAVRGKMQFGITDIDDFVALKSDGFPTYNFANVVDDHEMEISHVLRAEEFLSSTPKHLLLYAAFGWKPPIFAHLPQVLGPDGKSKLSKRHGAQSVLDYRDQGYLPEAVVNFMALLGWNEGEGSTKEIYTPEELAKAFSLERIQKSPAVFNAERLTWMNGLYIREMKLDELAKRAENFWPDAADKFDSEYKKSVLGLEQERLKILSELPEITEYFFEDPKIDKDQFSKWPEADKILESARKIITSGSETEPAFRAAAEKLGLKASDLFMVTRIAITGRTVSPGLFETIEVLGKETAVRRLESAHKVLS